MFQPQRLSYARGHHPVDSSRRRHRRDGVRSPGVGFTDEFNVTEAARDFDRVNFSTLSPVGTRVTFKSAAPRRAARGRFN